MCQIRSFLRIWSHLLTKSLMENFIFCAVPVVEGFVSRYQSRNLLSRCGDKHYSYMEPTKHLPVQKSTNRNTRKKS